MSLTPRLDVDSLYADVTHIDTPTRERVLAALDVLVHLALVGEMSHTVDERIARTEICQAVLLAELDSYQSLLQRMKKR